MSCTTHSTDSDSASIVSIFFKQPSLPNYLTILEWERTDEFIPFPKALKVKHEQIHPGFELRLPVSFPMMKFDMLCLPFVDISFMFTLREFTLVKLEAFKDRLCCVIFIFLLLFFSFIDFSEKNVDSS